MSLNRNCVTSGVNHPLILCLYDIYKNVLINVDGIVFVYVSIEKIAAVIGGYEFKNKCTKWFSCPRHNLLYYIPNHNTTPSLHWLHMFR